MAMPFAPAIFGPGITGKSAEIISTDAEGRLILADALGYVAQYNPKAVVDLATLTGAIGVALGSQAAGLFANDDALQEALLAAAGASGERLWPMPMYDEYKDEIKSDMAEVKNSAGRYDPVWLPAPSLLNISPKAIRGHIWTSPLWSGARATATHFHPKAQLAMGCVCWWNLPKPIRVVCRGKERCSLCRQDRL